MKTQESQLACRRAMFSELRLERVSPPHFWIERVVSMSIAAPCIPVIAALMGTTKRSVGLGFWFYWGIRN